MGNLLILMLAATLAASICRAHEVPSIEQLQKLAGQGDGESQFALALLHEHGEQGIIRDPEKAAALFLQAAKAGIPAACLYLGIKYENGGGVIKNQTEAARCYCCAAQKNWAMAQFFLAGLYEKGKGVRKDKIKALAWYSLAEEQGYPGSREAIIRLTVEMSAAEQKEAARLRQKLLSPENCSGL
jgi:TPR repeat protein